MEKPILDFCLLPFILTTLNLFVLYNFSCPVFNTCVKNIFKTKVKRHKSTFAYQKKKKRERDDGDNDGNVFFYYEFGWKYETCEHGFSKYENSDCKEVQIQMFIS